MTKTITGTAGIDTSKAKLDIAIDGQARHWQVTNDAAGWRRLTAELQAAGIERVGIEATGGYEGGVVRALRAAGLVVVVLEPTQVRAYAKVRRRRAKNDALDAKLIAACAATAEAPAIAADPRLAALAEALTFVEQTEADIARLKTRLEHLEEQRLRRLIEADIKGLKARRDGELLRLSQLLRAADDLGRRLELVLSVPGIGLRTALTILIRLPELGQISREKVAALAGLAPFDNDSGKYSGQRHIAGGRSRLRRALFNAALPAAMRWNKALVDLYSRLTQRGKPHKLALIACARKLLIFANTVVQRGTPWTNETSTI